MIKQARYRTLLSISPFVIFFQGWDGEGSGRGFRMGNTCTPMADSWQCMTKPLFLKKNIFKKSIHICVQMLTYTGKTSERLGKNGKPGDLRGAGQGRKEGVFFSHCIPFCTACVRSDGDFLKLPETNYFFTLDFLNVFLFYRRIFVLQNFAVFCQTST